MYNYFWLLNMELEKQFTIHIFKHILYSSENRLDLLWFFVNICHLKKIEIDKYLVYSIPSHLGLGQCNGGTFS
jgi:hypothetical protein